MKTNNLKYNTTKIKNGLLYVINIRLNDECKNGHQDFAITGSIYPNNKPKTDSNMISCGAIGDEISKFFPEFKIFNNLHRCDYLGIPMYCASNGFFQLKNGFNRTKPNDNNFSAEFCEYYRITQEQFEVLSTSKDKIHYSILLEELNVFEQWKAEADKAIKILEELTGNKFIVDSVKTQYDKPKPEELQKFKERLQSGYYTDEAEQQRAKERINKKLKELENEAKNSIDKINKELEIKKAVLLAGVHYWTEWEVQEDENYFDAEGREYNFEGVLQD